LPAFVGYDALDSGTAQSPVDSKLIRLRGFSLMLDALYRRRLETDLQVWRERGLVSPDSVETILASVKVESGPRTANIVGFLGAVLIAFAAIAFVASNWDEMARPLRLALLVAGMALCYFVAAVFNRARHAWLADAAIFTGAALFGASIILVAQSYHISGDYPDALLTWGAGAFLAAVFGPSRAALTLALLVLGLWSWYETIDFGWVVHWPFLVALALVGAVVGTWNWRSGMHLVSLALAGWIGITVVSLADHLDLSIAAAICLSGAISIAAFGTGRFMASRRNWTKTGHFGGVLSIYGLFGFLALFILLQIALREGPSPSYDDDRVALIGAAILVGGGAILLALSCAGSRSMLLDAAVPVLIAVGAAGLTLAASGSYNFSDSLWLQVLLGVLALVAGVWAVAYGNRNGSRAAATFGLVAFAGEVLYLYFVTFGTLLDTALFFLIGGLLLIGLAAVLVRLQRRLAPAETGAPA
jgi:uncharacterized membrane protein